MRLLAYVFVDLAICAIATVAALLLRENFVLDPVKVLNLVPYLVATLLAAGVIIPLTGLNRRLWRFSTMEDAKLVLVCCVTTMIAATIGTFIFNRLDGIARSTPVLQCLIAFLGMMSVRYLARLRNIESQPARPFTSVTEARPQNVLLIGLTSLTHLYVRAVHEFGDGRVRIAGIVDGGETNDGMLVGGHLVHSGIGSLASLLGRLTNQGVVVDRIVLTTNRLRLPRSLQDELTEMTGTGRIPVVSIADVFGSLGWSGPKAVNADRVVAAPHAARPMTFEISDSMLQEIRRKPYWMLKRTLDAITAAVLLLAMSPLIAGVALVVYLNLGRPILFWQQRPGASNRPFFLVKFRTMHDSGLDGRMLTDSERIEADARRSNEIGRRLRRLRLDELPQLWNILVGQMSFIGPRPLLPVDQASEHAARLYIRPGLTGWAQVKGGRTISSADKAALDIWYLMNASFRLDIQIVLETLRLLRQGETIDHNAIARAWADLERLGIHRSAAADTSDARRDEPAAAGNDRAGDQTAGRAA